MPAVPGENLLTTLFADVHYYFNDPSSKPLHHRVSKGSYAYIYYNPTERRGKLEVANHAGTPEQDSFSGYLSAVDHVRYSYKQPALCTVVLATQSIQGHSEWHLPAYDERNEQKFLYKIDTLDIYLWTEKDAATFLGHLKAVLPADKLDIRDAPPALEKPGEHRDSMSPVVQQLEKTAVSAHFPPRAESTASTHSFPGPPTPSTGMTSSPAPQPRQQQPSPFAYNPAAPAAPEPIAHREKTPPPVEDGSGHGPGLSGNRAPPPSHMQFASAPPQGFHPSQQNTPQQSYFPGPPHLQQQRHPSSSSMHMPGPPQGGPPQGTPPNQRSHSGSLPPPPPPPSGPSPSQYTPSFGPPPTDAQSPPPNQTSFHRQSVMGQPAQQFASYPSQQFASFPQSPGFGPSVGTPGVPPPHTPGFTQQQPPTPSAPPSYNTHTPLQSPNFPPNNAGSFPPPPTGQPPNQQQQPPPPPPIGGYSSYSYGQGAQAQAQPGAYNPHGAYTGDVHNQTYRPTETESSYGAKARPTPPQQESSSSKYKVNDRVDKVEKGVGRFLKKLDSKW